MTKEELKHIFLKSVMDLRNKDLLEQDSLLDVFEDVIEPYISELEQQVNKMKCCGNCKHRHYWGNELGCNLDFDKQFECDNNNKKYWEFSEV